jgi:hypothetical protein
MGRMRWILGMALLSGACGGDDGGPHIDSLAPSEAAVGATVEILGEHFCGDSGALEDGRCMETVAGFVTFGTSPGIVRADVASWKETRISVTVPSGVTGPTSVVVTVDQLESNAKGFEVLP